MEQRIANREVMQIQAAAQILTHLAVLPGVEQELVQEPAQEVVALALAVVAPAPELAQVRVEQVVAPVEVEQELVEVEQEPGGLVQVVEQVGPAAAQEVEVEHRQDQAEDFNRRTWN